MIKINYYTVIAFPVSTGLSMCKIAPLFLVGNLLFQVLPTIPSPVWLAVVLMVGLILVTIRRLRVGICIVAGFLLSWWQADSIISHTLPKNLEGKDVVIEGRVTGIPEWDGRRYRFDVKLQQFWKDGVRLMRDDLPEKVRLSWYHPQASLHSGEVWRFGVRMKRPHGWRNPGGFDYEGWLYQHEINATGYVRKIPEPV
ncbi:MAG: DUF4131 domain-containing protein, partial [Gammaproteobacteria bacterium]